MGVQAEVRPAGTEVDCDLEVTYTATRPSERIDGRERSVLALNQRTPKWRMPCQVVAGSEQVGRAGKVPTDEFTSLGKCRESWQESCSKQDLSAGRFGPEFRYLCASRGTTQPGSMASQRSVSCGNWEGKIRGG